MTTYNEGRPVLRPTGVAVFRPGRVPAETRVDLPVLRSSSEIWRGPEDVLRAQLRDEARALRVKPLGDVFEVPGLPRGWVAMRVYFTERELTRDIKPKRRLWPWITVGAVGILGGIVSLGYWLFTVIAAAAAGISVATWVGGLIVLALLLSAAGGSTIVRVVVDVVVKR